MRHYICSGLAAASFISLGSALHAHAIPLASPELVRPTSDCTSLKGLQIAPSDIGIPSGAGMVVDASVQTEPLGGTEYCKVTGEIKALTAGASPIQFQVNLPKEWNRKFIMTGGGGFNGVILGGIGPLRDAPFGVATPLSQGYATASTDSGHHIENRDDPNPAKFALNEEMFRNFAHESYKKTSDVARAVLKHYYAHGVHYAFYFGGSEGGREGLTMAQRYPYDFNGIVSVVPVISWTGLMSSFAGFVLAQKSGGAVSPEEARLFATKVMATCDQLDGIKDGAASNYLGCRKEFSVSSLQCAPNDEPGFGCLTQEQIVTLKAAYEPTKLPSGLANGTTNYPGRLFGGEVQVPGDNFTRWVSTGTIPATPPTAKDARGVQYGSNFIRFVVTQDPNFDVSSYDPSRFTTRLKEISALMDSTNPDLDKFFKAGGKLIIRENAGDTAQSPIAGFNYYESVVRRMGQREVDKFMRLYVSPSSAHSGQAFSLTTGDTLPTQHDLLADIDRWVATGQSPGDVLEQVATDSKAPYSIKASRPMCSYPNYPRYVAGDPSKFASYRCTISQ